MAELPDAPWATQAPAANADLPDAPWATPATGAASLVGQSAPAVPFIDRAAANAVRPFTSLPATQDRYAREGWDQMRQGWSEVRKPATASLSDYFSFRDPAAKARARADITSAAKGVGEMGLGAMGYLGSWPNAAIHTLFGQPVQDTTGIPAEVADFALGTLGPGALARLPKAPPSVPPITGPASDVAQASQRLGVPIPKAVATDNLVAQRTAAALKEVPFIGDPIVKASRAASEGLGNVAERTAQQFGHGNILTGGEGAKEALIDRIGPRSRAVMDRMYGRVDAVVDPAAVGPLNQTSGIANNIIARRYASGADTGSAVGIVTDAITRPGGLTYQGLKDLRTRVGSYLDGSILPESGTSIPELKQLYGGLTDDLRSLIRSNGGQSALDAFDRANAIARQVSARREILAKIVGTDASAPPERVLDRLYQMASTKSSADINRLTAARKAMGQEPWNEVASGVISRIGRDAEGNFSADRFLTAYGRLSPEGKKLLFGSTGRQDLVQALDDIATISSRAKQMAAYGNPSGTGRTLTTVGGLGALFTEPLTALSTAITGRFVAQAMAKPVTARRVANWASAYQNMQNSRSPTAAAAYGMATASLARGLSTLGIDPAALQRLRTISGSGPAQASEKQQKRGGRINNEPNGSKNGKTQHADNVPPMLGARKAPDGHWYVKRRHANGEWMRWVP